MLRSILTAAVLIVAPLLTAAEPLAGNPLCQWENIEKMWETPYRRWITIDHETTFTFMDIVGTSFAYGEFIKELNEGYVPKDIHQVLPRGSCFISG